jgi:hypothetical protein
MPIISDIHSLSKVVRLNLDYTYVENVLNFDSSFCSKSMWRAVASWHTILGDLAAI